MIVVLDQASDNSSKAQFAELQNGLKKFTPVSSFAIIDFTQLDE